jgi:acyl-CoA synthetase (NDP forming)
VHAVLSALTVGEVNPRGAPPASKLDALLRPQSIAVVGASEREGSFGQRLLAAVRSGRYAGRLYPVNPRSESMGGLRCYPDLRSLPETPDCAAFAVSDDHIEAALAAAADCGVPAAAIFGRAYEAPRLGTPSRVERLSSIARSAGMAVCGSNCMGFVNFVDGLKVSGNPPPIPERFGSVGLISHSGSTWSGFIGNQRDLVFNYAVSAGQEIATTMADYLGFLLSQPETRVVGCIMETLRDPERFLEAAETADRQGVPVVVLKLGRSERGRTLALAHSGALTGSDSAYRAVFERRNVVLTRTPDELADALELFGSPRRPPAPGIGIVTDSGGERELIVDLASDLDAPLAELTPETEARLNEVLDPGMTPENPVDSYGDGRTLLQECLSAIAGDPEVGIVALATNLVHGRPYLHRCTSAIEAVFNATQKPALVFGNLHSTISREAATRLRELGVPVLMGTATALLAMKHFGEWQGRRMHGRDEPLPANAVSASALASHASALAACGTKALPPQHAFELLGTFGIPTAPSLFVASAPKAAEAAERLGFPVVLKTANPDVLHKSDNSGVVLGLADRKSVIKAFDRIAAVHGPPIQVQAQAEPGAEVLLGMTSDPTFGPMMTLGLGGILTELIRDALAIEPPISAADARRRLTHLKGYRLLEGYRGRPKADVASLACVIERFSLLCSTLGANIDAIDINPVLAGPSGAVAVDVLIIPKRGNRPSEETS